MWRRDGGRCAFVGTKGRCTERAFLEVDHMRPAAHQGPATVENLSLRCRAHNVYEAEAIFGRYEPPWCANGMTNILFPGKSHPFRNGGPE